MRTLNLAGLILVSIATGFLMGTSHSPSYAATSVQYTLFTLGQIAGCPSNLSTPTQASNLNTQMMAAACAAVESKLDALGAKGWRLVTVVDGNGIFMK